MGDGRRRSRGPQKGRGVITTRKDDQKNWRGDRKSGRLIEKGSSYGESRGWKDTKLDRRTTRRPLRRKGNHVSRKRNIRWMYRIWTLGRLKNLGAPRLLATESAGRSHNYGLREEQDTYRRQNDQRGKKKICIHQEFGKGDPLSGVGKERTSGRSIRNNYRDGDNTQLRENH